MKTVYPISNDEWNLIEKLVVESQRALLKNTGQGKGKFDPRNIIEVIVMAVELNCGLNTVKNAAYPAEATRFKYYNWFNEEGVLLEVFELLEQTRPGITERLKQYNIKREKIKEKQRFKKTQFVSTSLAWGK